MATRYEYYNTGDDGETYAYGIYWFAQTFTPSEAHKITSVKLKLYRKGSPGTITVSIRATDGSGHPTGANLCSGTINGNTLTTSSPGLWYEITLGAGYDLKASTQYAIVVRALGGDVGNTIGWRQDGSSPTYADGIHEISSNSGVSWTGLSQNDKMFEEWGEPIAPTVTTQAVSNIGAPTATGNGNITDKGSENCSKRGVCWNITGNPTVADDKSEETDSFGVGAFTRPMTGLLPTTHYYVKAYAYNSAGYGYGSQVEFTTKAYYATGYIGDVIDCTELVKTYDRLEWTEEIPSPEQAIEIKIRSSPDLSTWTDWAVIYSSPCTSFTIPVQRYLEWVATLTTDQSDTPKLKDLAFFWTKKVE